MHHDQIGDSVEDIVPMAACLGDLIEKPGIFQGHRRMGYECLQQTLIILSELGAAIG